MTNSEKSIFSFRWLLTALLQSIPLLLCLFLFVIIHKITFAELTIIYSISLITLYLVNRSFARKMALQDKNSTHNREDSWSSQNLLSKNLDNLADPFLLIDCNHKILMANGSAKKMYGKNILKNSIDLYLKNQNVLEAISHTFETGTSNTVEFKSGTGPIIDHFMRLHILNTSPARENRRKNPYLLMSIYDITEIKQAEKMRVSFVANASHELRTPLASILGFIETLQGPAKNDLPAQERFLKIMYDEAKRMSRLIHDLLSLSRIERDEHIPPEDKLDLPILISNVVETLELILVEKNMQVTPHQSENYLGHKGDILGDYDQLVQVFQNLIENAIKYGSQNSEICIEYALEESSISENKISITITNQGHGIAAQHLPHLMERFYRVDTARSRAMGGTGLGLAIVKHIILRHRGQIFFESEVDKFTRVTIHLPLSAPILAD